VIRTDTPGWNAGAGGEAGISRVAPQWPYDAAMFYAALNDKDRAFEWLEKEREIHSGWLLIMRVDPRLCPLRSDPRFEDLAQRVGLPTPPER
jgi:hypothetical protein